MKIANRILIFFLVFLSSTSFALSNTGEEVLAKYHAWVRAIKTLSYTGSDLTPFFKLKEYKALLELGIKAIPTLVELNKKDPFVSAPIKEIAKLRFRSKPDSKAPGFKTYLDFPEIPHPVQAITFWWTQIRPNIGLHFARFYSNWKEGLRCNASDVEDRAQAIASLGVDTLPFLIERISMGDDKLINLVNQLTNGDLGENATPKECLVWWEENKLKWTIPSK